MKTSRMVSTSKCPVCGKNLTGAVHASADIRPKRGDISVCTGCLEVLEFSDDIGNCILPERNRLQEIHITAEPPINWIRAEILRVNKGKPWKG
jgi:hypothetical protein